MVEQALDHETGKSHGDADPKISVVCPSIRVKLNLSLFFIQLFSPLVDEITSFEIRNIVLQRSPLNDSSKIVITKKNEENTNRDEQRVNPAHALKRPLLRLQIKDGFFAGTT